MSGGRSPRHAQNPLLGERRKTLSITHHALSPPPSHHHVYIIHLINWLQRFYLIAMSLKRVICAKKWRKAMIVDLHVFSCFISQTTTCWVLFKETSNVLCNRTSSFTLFFYDPHNLFISPGGSVSSRTSLVRLDYLCWSLFPLTVFGGVKIIGAKNEIKSLSKCGRLSCLLNYCITEIAKCFQSLKFYFSKYNHNIQNYSRLEILLIQIWFLVILCENYFFLSCCVSVFFWAFFHETIFIK